MATELAVLPGYARPTDLPRGECILRLDNGSLRVDHADPQVLISAELLSRMEQDPADWPAWVDVSGCDSASFVGAVLRVEAVNRQLVYRITKYVAAVHAYVGEWPD